MKIPLIRPESLDCKQNTQAHSKTIRTAIALLITALAISPCALSQQQPPSPESLQVQPSLKPGESYNEAMRPLDVVRQSLDNWSEPELAAFEVVKQKAKEACAKSTPDGHSGQDLYDYVRLCALGQDWKNTNAGALQYLAWGDQTYRAQAYAMSMEALIRLQDATSAINTAKSMLHEMPYDATVAQSFWFLITFLDANFDSRAIEMAKEQHPFLVDALKKHAALNEIHGDGRIEIGNLYQEGFQLAFLQRYKNQQKEAEQTVKELKDALDGAQPLSLSDSQAIEKTDTRYSLLGKKLPKLPLSASLLSPKAKPAMAANPGVFVALTVFPEWCAQCVKMTKNMHPEIISVGAGGVSLKYQEYGLMVPNKSGDASLPKEERFKALLGTPTFITTSDTLDKLGASDYPLGIIANEKGIICFVGLLPANAFHDGSYVFRKVLQLAAQERNNSQEAVAGSH